MGTHASSQPIAGKQFMNKYFNVQTPGDECDNDTCECSGAPTIEQGRVFTTREIDPSAGMSPGNGFGLHLVSVPGHKTSGGLTIEEVEANFKAKLGEMTTFDSFMDYNVVLATNSLQTYKAAFDRDGVKYLVGTWSDSQNSQYSSIIVQVPGSQLILELVQKTSLMLTEDQIPVQLEQRVPDSVLAEQEERRAAKQSVLDTSRADSATSTDFKVGDFEDMLNKVHKTIIDGHPYCPMDRWFDNHYAIDSRSVGNSKILSYVNSKKVYHTCGSNPMRGSGTSAIFDPTGLGIQMDTSIGLASDCSTNFLRATSSTHNNPACTVDTSQCGPLSVLV